MKDRPKCAYCGKAYGARETHRRDVITETEKRPPAPSNQIVSRYRAWQQFHTADRAAPMWIHSFDMWDGESFIGTYRTEPFCSFVCAMKVARKVYARKSLPTRK